MITANIFGEIAQLRRVEMHAGQKFREHSHRETQYEIMLSGQYVKTIQNTPVEHRRGIGYLMSSHVAHRCEYTGSVQSLSLDFLRGQDNERLTKSKLLAVDSNQLGIFAKGVASNLVSEAQSPDEFSPLAIDAFASELLLGILRHQTARQIAPKISRMNSVMERLEDTSQSPATVRELASIALVHPGHLAREFRLQFGIPIATFQRQFRLQAATQALIEGAAICDIALEAGYNAQSQFTTAFKKAFGSTPARYRRKHCA